MSERRHILSTLANIKFFTVDGFSYFILAHTTTWSVFKMGVYIPPVRSSILNGRGKVTFCYGITVTDVHNLVLGTYLHYPKFIKFFALESQLHMSIIFCANELIQPLFYNIYGADHERRYKRFGATQSYLEK